jgi:hypothetical protein
LFSEGRIVISVHEAHRQPDYILQSTFVLINGVVFGSC